MQDLLSRPKEEIKEVLRQQLRDKKKRAADDLRLAELNAEVEVEEEWKYWNLNKLQKENVNRWFNETCNGNYKTYLSKIDRNNIPPIFIQKQKSPDEYTETYDSYDNSFKWVEKTQLEEDKKSSRLAALILAGSMGLLLGGIFLAIHFLG